jgi:hypothetical protein
MLELKLDHYSILAKNKNNQKILKILFPETESARREQKTGWVSPSYGKKIQTSIVYQCQETSLPTEMVITFVPISNDGSEKKRSERACQRFWQVAVEK